MSADSPTTPVRRILPFLGAVAALLAIASAPWALDKPWLNFAFKPLATLCVIAWAALGRSDDGLVKRWIVIGLVFSLLGDIALLWPVQGFLAGLVAFLLGHLSYLVALTRRVKFLASRPAFGVWTIVAASVVASLWAGVPADMRVPVLVYVTALSAMAAQATSVWLARRGQPDAAKWRVVAIGAALFVLSDAILATDKFVGGVPLPTLWNLSIYWLGQWFIARAAVRAPEVVS
jgi:uncharacterized membrane protein YhhN